MGRVGEVLLLAGERCGGPLVPLPHGLLHAFKDPLAVNGLLTDELQPGPAPAGALRILAGLMHEFEPGVARWDLPRSNR
jgi:hypothetical protein